MFKKIFQYSLGGVFMFVLFLLSSSQVSAATATFTGTATMTASSSTTVTITVPGTTLTKFVSANGTTANATDLAGVVFNSQVATAGTTNGTNLATFTFPIAAGTNASGSLVIQAGVMVDTVNNILTTIVAGSITDNAPPQVLSVSPSNTSGSNDRYNPIVIHFSEPMTTSSLTFATSPVFTYTATWSNANATVSLSHNTFSSGQLHTATISAGTDAAAGLNAIPSLPYVWTFTTTIGSSSVTTIAPVVPTNMSVSINNGATSTDSHDVVLTLAATNAISMRVSNNPFFTDSGWEVYATSKNWTLTSGIGTKAVYVKFISSSGVESEPIVSNIVINQTVATSSPVAPSTSPVSPIVPNTPSTSTVSNPSTSAAPVVYNFGTVTLKNGSKGNAVMELQKFLNAKLNLGLVVDGKLGPKTIAIIKKWQKANGLKADGLIGTKTKALMNSMAQ